MTRADVARLAVSLAGGVGCLSMLGWLGWTWGAGLAIAAIFITTSTAAERAYKRLATTEHQRADLEDRLRNPPS